MRGQAREGPQGPGRVPPAGGADPQGLGPQGRPGGRAGARGARLRAQLLSLALSSVLGGHRAEPQSSILGPKGGVQRSVPHCSPPRPTPGPPRAGGEGGQVTSQGAPPGPGRTPAHGPLLPPCGGCGESSSPRARGGVGSGSAPNSRPHGRAPTLPNSSPPCPVPGTSPASRACPAKNQGQCPLRVHRRSPARAHSGSRTPPCQGRARSPGSDQPPGTQAVNAGPVAWRPRALGLGRPGPRLRAGHPTLKAQAGSPPPTLQVPGRPVTASLVSEGPPGKLLL